MPSTFAIRDTARYHADATCPALDSTRLNHSGTVLQIDDTTGHTPCIVCADTDRTEWTLTPETLWELLELIGPSKPHWAPLPADSALGVSTQVDGLTVLAHRGLPRAVARFGDKVICVKAGTYVVEPAEVAEFDDRDYCQACTGTVDTCVCSDQVTPHPSQL